MDISPKALAAAQFAQQAYRTVDGAVRERTGRSLLQVAHTRAVESSDARRAAGGARVPGRVIGALSRVSPKLGNAAERVVATFDRIDAAAAKHTGKGVLGLAGDVATFAQTVRKDAEGGKGVRQALQSNLEVVVDGMVEDLLGKVVEKAIPTVTHDKALAAARALEEQLDGVPEVVGIRLGAEPKGDGQTFFIQLYLEKDFEGAKELPKSFQGVPVRAEVTAPFEGRDAVAPSGQQEGDGPPLGPGRKDRLHPPSPHPVV